MRTLTWIVTGIAVAAWLPAAAPGAEDKIEAITRPSEDVSLSFTRPGRVAKVFVKDGNSVKAGQELMRLDDEAEQAQLASLKAQAEDDTRLLAAEAQLAQKRVDLDKVEVAQRQGGATLLEVEHAKLDVRISELSLVLARFERKLAGLKYDEGKVQLERMRLISPIDGLVERTQIEPGESAEALKEVVRVVKIDPLWIDVAVLLPQTQGLRKGQADVVVEFPAYDGSRPQRTTGRIIHISAVADPASGTLAVRVEAPNPSGRPAGEHVLVSFPKAPQAAGSGRAEPIAARGAQP